MEIKEKIITGLTASSLFFYAGYEYYFREYFYANTFYLKREGKEALKKLKNLDKNKEKEEEEIVREALVLLAKKENLKNKIK